MFKRTVIALALVISSASLVACGDNKHVAITPKQKQQQADKNQEQMNVLSEELLAEGFPLYPPAELLNFATEAVGKTVVEVSGNEKLDRVQGKLDKFIDLAKETLKYSKSSKVSVPDAEKIELALKNAKAYDDAIIAEQKDDKQEKEQAQQ